jgi:hypothetical protein
VDCDSKIEEKAGGGGMNQGLSFGFDKKEVPTSAVSLAPTSRFDVFRSLQLMPLWL